MAARSSSVRCASIARAVVGVLAVVLAVGSAPTSAQDEVPFIVTPDAVTLAMLELAGVTAVDRVVDLGSGDGRIVITAARRFGARGLGVEIVPELVRTSREAARAAGVAGRVEFREQDLFATDLAGATVVAMYLLPDVNLQLRPRLLALAPGTRIVSHDWDLGDWRPDRTVTVDVPDKPIGREKVSRVHRWVVPARVEGRWCGPSARLDIAQRFQRFSATLSGGDARGSRSTAPAAVFDGGIDGTSLHADGVHAATLRLDGEVLRLLVSPVGVVPAQAFVRAGGEACR